MPVQLHPRLPRMSNATIHLVCSSLVNKRRDRLEATVALIVQVAVHVCWTVVFYQAMNICTGSKQINRWTCWLVAVVVAAGGSQTSTTYVEIYLSQSDIRIHLLTFPWGSLLSCPSAILYVDCDLKMILCRYPLRCVCLPHSSAQTNSMFLPTL